VHRWLVPVLLGLAACDPVPSLSATPGIAYDVDSGSFDGPAQFAPVTLSSCGRIVDAGSALWRCETAPGVDEAHPGASEGVLIDFVFLQGFFGRPGEVRQMGASFLVTRVHVASNSEPTGRVVALSTKPEFEGELSLTLQEGNTGHLKGWVSSSLLVLNIDTQVALPPPPPER
jgi:hypothetical protein